MDEQVKNGIISLEKLKTHMGGKFDNEIKTLKTDVQLGVKTIEEIVSKSCYETAVVYVGGGMEKPRVPNVKSAKKVPIFLQGPKGV